MSYSTGYRLLVAFFIILYCSQPFAHDLGVTNAILEQSSPQTYVLKVATSSASAYQISAPGLPPRCMLQKPFKGLFADGELTFSFSCDDGLTANDVLQLRWQRNGVLLTVVWPGKEPAKSLFLRNNAFILVPLSELSAVSASIQVKAKRYLELGVSHILSGYDHLLFVFGIILIVGSPVLLLKTITAFTIGHSITLALSFLQIIRLSIAPVEACITLSIAVLAHEIIRINRGEESLTGKYPWVVATGFGLLHGLGFAGALNSLGVSTSDVPQALLFFNVGVELGQLFFISLMLCFAYAAKHVVIVFGFTCVHKSSWSNPLAYGIGIITMYWTIERSVSIFT
jgi:hypothetical protein